MRVLLFTGKGGVGKTTLSAATGVHLARSGRRVLVCSTDPAHSLGDALDHPLGGQPRTVEPNLSAVQLDTRALLERSWAPLRSVLVELAGRGGPDGGPPGADVAALEAAELTVLPGVEELLALAEVRRLAELGCWDVLVLDCGPTAETLRMLALPETVSGYLRRAWPRHRRVLQATLGRVGTATTSALAAVERLDDEARSVQALLTDAARTSVRLVLTPERVVLAETRRTLTSLALHGLRVDGVVANRVLPTPRPGGRSTDPAWEWLRTRASEQAQVLTDLVAAVPAAVTTTVLAHRPGEPVGTAALAALADELYRDHPVLAAPAADVAPVVELESGTGLDAVYVWRMLLPQLGGAEVELGRLEDDLLVRVGTQRRRMTLPPGLRRCAVVDAEVDGDALLVRMQPDPATWLR